eukprot:5183660-Amphidinium_carterae.1
MASDFAVLLNIIIEAVTMVFDNLLRGLAVTSEQCPGNKETLFLAKYSIESIRLLPFSALFVTRRIAM